MTSPTRTGVLAAVALVAAGMLAACTAAPSPSPTPTSTPTTASPGITDVQDAPGTGTGFEGALSDTTVDTCEQADGGWAVAGTVTNPTDAAADYRIYVSLLDPAGDTRALVQVDAAAVEPAASEEWAVDIAAPESELTCVLRVERYPAA